MQNYYYYLITIIILLLLVLQMELQLLSWNIAKAEVCHIHICIISVDI